MKRGASNNAIKLLKELFIADVLKKFPSIPINRIAVYQYNDRTSNGLTKCIIDFIKFNNQQAERINCIGRAIDKRKLVTDIIGNTRLIGSLEYIPTTGTRGTADISATIKGKSVKIEVKIAADKQSEAQKQYQQAIEASGGIYFIAKDFQSFFDFYTKTFENNGK